MTYRYSGFSLLEFRRLMLVFVEEGTQKPAKNQENMASTPGFEPRPHWEVTALTATYAPSLSIIPLIIIEV